jgi:RimJ/RimL family protein N-acetyltransferase
MNVSENNSSHDAQYVSPIQPSRLCRLPCIVYTQEQPTITVRRVGPHDGRLLTDLLARLSDRSHWLRYMLPQPRAAEALEHEARRMLLGATGHYFTLIALSQPPGQAVALAVGELALDAAEPTSAEVAMLVRDDVQGQGIGTLLGIRLLQAAGQLGITSIHAELLAENSASLRRIQRLGLPFRIIRGTIQVVLSCDQPRAIQMHAEDAFAPKGTV